MKPFKEANGAAPVAPNTSVASLTKASTPPATDQQPIQRQTHGAMPQNGAISSVGQLIRGPNVSRGSVGTFATLDEYRAYLNTLSLGALHRHALEEVKIVPIDDRNRLIRRLEGEWGALAARSVGRGRDGFQPPQPKLFTQEQTDAQEAIRRKLLKS